MTELYTDISCTFDVEPLSVVENEKDNAEICAARRLKWMARCGKPRPRVSKKTGSIYFPIFYCGYAGCPICHDVIMDELVHRPYLAMLEGNEVSVSVLDRVATDALVSQMDKTQYLRLPGVEQDTLFFLTTVLPEQGHVVTKADLDDFDWDTLATRTVGRKRSGKLGNPPKPWEKVAADAIEMTLPDHDVFAEKSVDAETGKIVTPTVSDYKDAVIEAYAAHPDLNPTDETTLAAALNTRAEDLAIALRKRGYQVHVAVKTCHVKLSLLEIKWVNRKSSLNSLDDYEFRCLRQAEELDLDTLN